MTENTQNKMRLYPHQEKLINNVRLAYKQGYQAPCIVSGCGSGKSVMIAYVIKKITDREKPVLFLVHRAELKDQIQETLEKFEVDMRFVYLGMVQSVVRRLHLIKPPHLIVTDESHHGLANSYKKIYEHFKDVKRLHFTATPIRLNGDGLGEVNDILVEGETVRWLIDNHYLSPYKYYAPKLIDDYSLSIKQGEYTTSSIKASYSDKKIYGSVTAHYLKIAENTQAIIYCYSIEQSKEIASEFNRLNINAAHIDGTTSKTERAKIIRDFRDRKIKILTNVDLIGEGFNVPDCETVILMRPTQSLSLHIQQSMRSMRYKPGKTAIIIDHVGNVNRHGLPDTEHTWTLEKANKKRKKSENTVKIKTCTKCYQVYPFEMQVCPYCGHIEQKKERKDLEIEETAELAEVTSFTLTFKQPRDCKSYKELDDLRKQRGYKPGWTYIQAKRLNLIK